MRRRRRRRTPQSQVPRSTKPAARWKNLSALRSARHRPAQRKAPERDKARAAQSRRSRTVFLPAAGALQGIDHLGRHVTLIVFGEDFAGGEDTARFERA